MIHYYILDERGEPVIEPDLRTWWQWYETAERHVALDDLGELTSSEPPNHPECARWSARNCPFLSNPNMVRREDEVSNNTKMRDLAAGIPITRNPGVSLLWFTREYEVFNAGGGKPLITMGRPAGVEWFCQGRAATRAEVDESIAGGIGALEAMARMEPGGIEDLRRKQAAFEKWLPKN